MELAISHICTTDSLRAGIEQEAAECFVCGRKTMFMDWCGCRCDTCGADTAWDNDLAGFIRSIRKITGLSRTEIAEKANLKPSTIKRYEWCWPSKKYYEWFKTFIKSFYDDLGSEGIKAKKDAAYAKDMQVIDKLMQEFNEK